jgi:ribosome-associated toxin RatA of RatAB toxin-antitoxin module
MDIERTALVLHSAHDMYRLVRDVPSYPQFLSWCLHAEVHEEDHLQQLASLEIRVSGIRQKFTTRNRFVTDRAMTLSLVDGPFSRLSGEWQFLPLGDQGSKITLRLGFEFSSKALSGAFRRGFAHVADRLVQEFCQRADEVYR